jgi:hypothetical protein
MNFDLLRQLGASYDSALTFEARPYTVSLSTRFTTVRTEHS